jgi:hypothetical protein
MKIRSDKNNNIMIDVFRRFIVKFLKNPGKSSLFLESRVRQCINCEIEFTLDTLDTSGM